MPQPFQVEDLYLHRKITDAHSVAAASAAVCTVRAVDRESDGYQSDLWLVPFDGDAPRPLTFGEGNNQSARWSPDGERIAFLSNRSGSTQVHLLELKGGEARACGQLPGSVSALRWAPDGEALYVTASVPVDPDRGRGASGGKRKQNSPEVAWKLPYKSDGMGYLLAREVHLFRLDVADGTHRQLTHGNFDVFGFDIAADGRIAFTRTRGGRFAHLTDLWVCGADGSSPRQLSRNLATVLQPVWSPDGRHIAFAGAEVEGDAQSNLYLADPANGGVRLVGTEDVEVASPGSVHWSPDGRQLYFARAFAGCHEACAIAPDAKEPQVLASGERQFGTFIGDGERFVYTVEHPSLPVELWTCAKDGSGERCLTDLNPWWKDRTPLDVEKRSFMVPDGRGGRERIEGWLIRARGAAPGGPLLNDVHGGPASYALLDFDTNVFWQVLCSRGWSVLALNTVGSASHGREFCSRLQGNWGELDLPQHLEAVRQLQDEGVCDERVVISGKSYGGFLSAWAVGHTGMFKAAVVMAPVGNIETHYGTSDGGYYADPLYVDSAPQFDRRRARDLSPLQHIEKSTTPVLFLQGKEDERCPKCQSEEMFVSLMRAGDTPTELVLYPGQDHHFLGEGDPSCREDAAERIIDWVNRWFDRPRAEPTAAKERAGHDQAA